MPSVRCIRVGVGAVEGRLLGVREGRLSIESAQGRSEFPLDAFREIAFRPVERPSYPPPFGVWSAEGRFMAVRRLAGGAEPGTVDLTGYGWRAEDVPLGALGAVARRSVLRGGAEEREAFDEARAAPPTAEDMLMVLRDGRRRAVSCVVEGPGGDGVTLSLAGRRLTLGWDAVEWLVLAPTQGGAPGPRHLIELTDGTALAVGSFEIAGGSLSGRDGAATWTVEARRLARVRVASGAYTYLSDARPADVVTEPMLEVVWPPRMDACVTGEPLRLGGRAFARGIGMHVRTEMTFALDGGGWSRFFATAGVDDAAGGLGAVVLRVEGDGVPLFESGTLRGGEAPVRISLDVAGVRRLTLVAEAGDPVAVSGQFADWAEARLARAPKELLQSPEPSRGRAKRPRARKPNERTGGDPQAGR